MATKPDPQQTTRHAPEELARAQAIVAKIDAKVTELLEPLAREIRIMKWEPEYAAIMWEAVAMKALRRAKENKHG